MGCHGRSLTSPRVGLVLVFLTAAASSHSQKTPVGVWRVTGPYLGQQPPGKTPKVFAPGLLSTRDHEAFYPFMDGGTLVMFDRWSRDTAEPDALSFRTYLTELKDGEWTEPSPTSTLEKPSDDSIPLAADGKTFYFASLRSRDGTGRSPRGFNIWMVRRTSDGFSNPRMLESPVNSHRNDIFPSATRDGTLYFFSEREGGNGGADLYRSRLVDGTYPAVENLGPVINTANDEIDPFIAPDESYLIYCSKSLEGHGGFDLYVSFRAPGGSWTDPVNMGEEINSAGYDWIPYVTAEHFFFGSDRSGRWDVYWVDAAVIDEHRPADFEGSGLAGVSN